MGLQTEGGVLLAVGGALANHADCCCEGGIDPDATWGCTCPTELDDRDCIVTVTGAANGPNCDRCSAINSVGHLALKGAGCTWSYSSTGGLGDYDTCFGSDNEAASINVSVGPCDEGPLSSTQRYVTLTYTHLSSDTFPTSRGSVTWRRIVNSTDTIASFPGFTPSDITSTSYSTSYCNFDAASADISFV